MRQLQVCDELAKDKTEEPEHEPWISGEDALASGRNGRAVMQEPDGRHTRPQAERNLSRAAALSPMLL